MGITIVVRKNGFPGAPAAMQRAVTDGLQQAGNTILADMQTRTPVDTGFLRNSETVSVRGTSMSFNASAPYAGYVHNGTRRMAARPFMREAIDAGQATIASQIASVAERYLGGGFG